MLKYYPDGLIQEDFKSAQEFRVNCFLVPIIIQSHEQFSYMFRYFVLMLAMCLDHVIEPLGNMS